MRKLLLILLLLFPQLPSCYQDEAEGTVNKYEGILVTKEHQPYKSGGACGDPTHEKFTICIRLSGTKEARLFETHRFGGFLSNKDRIKTLYYGYKVGESVTMYWKE